MIRLVIQTPIFHSKSIGVAEQKCVDDLEIEIAYRDKDGQKVYPGVYYLGWEKALTYPVQMVKGTKLRIIPIVELTPMTIPDGRTKVRELLEILKGGKK